MSSVRRVLEMIRFSHTLFALPFALFGAVLAWHRKGTFAWVELVGILVCMVLARSAAMAFNRLADWRLDAANPRTASRHLPSGQLRVGIVAAFTLLCGAAFVAATFLFYLAQPANPWPSYLAVPVLVFVGGYSYTKRFTALAHFWLGASLLLAPVAAWIAILGLEQLTIPFVLGAAVLFWVAGFDIIYACQDADFDRQAELHSIPAWLGVSRALTVARLSHLIMLVLLSALYFLAHPPLDWLYVGGVVAAAALIAYEHALVRADDLTRVNQAFFHVNACISIGLFLVALLDVLRAE